ncbi:unnamed protein product, partial [Meganyctiphanes norvegica]
LITMKVTLWMLGSLCLMVAMVTAEEEDDPDFVDPDSEEDLEKDMKCDACGIIAGKFSEFFAAAEKEKGGKLKEEDIIEAAEATCDMTWEGFGTIVKDGKERLVSVISKDDTLEQDAIWPRRLQDFCDELLAESPDEKTLYNIYRGGENAFEDFLCRGEGLYTACTADNWGPWPGDDYDDYEDHDFDYVHDEF